MAVPSIPGMGMVATQDEIMRYAAVNQQQQMPLINNSYRPNISNQQAVQSEPAIVKKETELAPQERVIV
jgi:hypothetical protein